MKEEAVDFPTTGRGRPRGGVMGPSPADPQLVEKIQADIMKLLAEKYDIRTFRTSFLVEYRAKGDSLLKEALKEIVWQDNCESF